MKTILVRRTPHADSVEWVSETPSENQSTIYHAQPAGLPISKPVRFGGSGTGKPPVALWLLMGSITALSVLAMLVHRPKTITLHVAPRATVGDLLAVHAGVKINGEPIRSPHRIEQGQAVETDSEGRARIRLDRGTTLLLDNDTKISNLGPNLRVEKGRVFVEAFEPATLLLAGATDLQLVLGAARAAIDARSSTPTIYAAKGDIALRLSGVEKPLHEGDTARLEAGSLSIAPEKGFDDWTSGLAAPWSMTGPAQRSVPEVWGRDKLGDPGSPLTIRSVDVNAKVLGEVAETTIATTFFNASERAVVADFRLAIPGSGIVSQFSTTRNGVTANASVSLAVRGAEQPFEPSVYQGRGDILEWAGDGWVRGSIVGVGAGQVVTANVTYVEWLTPVRTVEEGSRLTYRLPLTGIGDPPLIGDFTARIDVRDANPIAISASSGAVVHDGAVTVRASEFKPRADLVVEVDTRTPISRARTYVSKEDGTVLFRAGIPEASADASGLQLAIVLDTSASMSEGMVDAAKAFVRALVSACGVRDKVVVFSGAHKLTAIGPATLGAATASHKQQILSGLDQLVRGGGSDLAGMLTAATEVMASEDPNALVLYVGDGFPSLGELSAPRIVASLSRKERKARRLGAVAVGLDSNTRLLAKITQGSGPLLSIHDSADAAALAVAFLSEATHPVVSDVAFDLGPTVERVYPRGGQVVRHGGTAWAVGKLIGPAPAEVRLTYRTSSGPMSEVIAVAEGRSGIDADVRRRWAHARATGLALEGRGRESVTDAALAVGLLTPWTAYTTQKQDYVASPLLSRVIALNDSSGFSAALFGEDVDSSRIAGAADRNDGDRLVESYEAATVAASRRVLGEAFALMRSCRDGRLPSRSDLVGAVEVRLSISGTGQAKDVKFSGITARDAAFEACLRTVVENLEYPRSLETKAVAVSFTVTFEPPRTSLRGQRCTATSRLPLSLRRGIFVERLSRIAPLQAWIEAKTGCELSEWAAKRSFADLVLEHMVNRPHAASAQLAFAKELDRSGDGEVARYVRHEVLRRAPPHELAHVRSVLLEGEALPHPLFEKQYGAATSDEARLAVTRRFLKYAPHSPRLRTRILFLLSALNDKVTLTEETRRLREDPLVDAVLLGDAAELLLKHGEQDESARTFFEIAERGGNDPWALAFLGDRLRNNQNFDAATLAYAGLEDLVPNQPASSLRRALAHAGAGRIDIATRLLLDLSRTGGRGADASMARLADATLRQLIISSSAGKSGSENRILAARLQELDSSERGARIIVRSEASEAPVTAAIVSGKDVRSPPSAAAPQVGMLLLVVDANRRDTDALELSIPKTLSPAATRSATIHVIVGEKLRVQQVELPLSGDPVRITLTTLLSNLE